MTGFANKYVRGIFIHLNLQKAHFQIGKTNYLYDWTLSVHSGTGPSNPRMQFLFVP
jgi:hypothetical protein